MPLTLTISVEPTDEPITLAEAKEQTRVDDTAEDPLITSYIKAARLYVEAYTRRQLVTATWVLKLDKFPSLQICVPRPPLSSVTSIGYEDENGDTQTWSSALWQEDTDSEPGRIKPIEGETFPNTQSDTYNAVTVTYVAGYGAASAVPERYKQAIKLLVAHWYRIREPLVDRGMATVPMSVDALLLQDRIWMF